MRRRSVYRAAGRAARSLLGLAAGAAFVGTAVGQRAGGTQSEAPPKADWRAFADCAAAYRANVESRQSDPDRTPAMRNMIEEQADEYRRAAVNAFIKTARVVEQTATKAVSARIEGSIDRFVAMDKAGALDHFLESCPEPDETGEREHGSSASTALSHEVGGEP